MATYITSKDGDEAPELQLIAWSPSPHWTDQKVMPFHWPTTKIFALIRLFRNHASIPQNQEKLEIPDQLAWHIAVLMDDWVQINANLHREDIIRVWYAQGIQIADMHHRAIQNNRDFELRTRRIAT